MIQQVDLNRLAELLEGPHQKENRSFNTDEIRFNKDRISIWDTERRDWYYLTKSLEWVSDYMDEDIFTF